MSCCNFYCSANNVKDWHSVIMFIGFCPYTWWAQLAPSEKYGGGVLIRL